MITREKMFNKVWTNTHKDFRGKIDGVKNIMILRGGSILVNSENITDDELNIKYEQALKKEARRKSEKASKG